MTTLEAVATRQKNCKLTAEETTAVELVRMAEGQGLSPIGPDGLLKRSTRSVPETAVNEEVAERLGHAKYQA